MKRFHRETCLILGLNCPIIETFSLWASCFEVVSPWDDFIQDGLDRLLGCLRSVPPPRGSYNWKSMVDVVTIALTVVFHKFCTLRCYDSFCGHRYGCYSIVLNRKLRITISQHDKVKNRYKAAVKRPRFNSMIKTQKCCFIPWFHVRKYSKI